MVGTRKAISVGLEITVHDVDAERGSKRDDQGTSILLGIHHARAYACVRAALMFGCMAAAATSTVAAAR
jgi:hypothetical protein